ncbi:MAG: hypothetical protein AAF519_07930 [Bacteroidota bacterium]
MKVPHALVGAFPVYLGVQSSLTDGFYRAIDKKDCSSDQSGFTKEGFCLADQPTPGCQVRVSATDKSRLGKGLHFDLKIRQAEASKLKRPIEWLRKDGWVLFVDRQALGHAKIQRLSKYTTPLFDSSRPQGKVNKIHAYLREVTN